MELLCPGSRMLLSALHPQPGFSHYREWLLHYLLSQQYLGWLKNRLCAIVNLNPTLLVFINLLNKHQQC